MLFLFFETKSNISCTLCFGDSGDVATLDKLARKQRAWKGGDAFTGTCLTAPERATAGAYVVSCRFCLFSLYAAALTLRFPRPVFRPMQQQPGLSAAAGLFAKFFCSGEKMDPRRFQQRGNGEILFCFPFLSKSHTSCSYSVATAARVRDLRRVHALLMGLINKLKLIRFFYLITFVN